MYHQTLARRFVWEASFSTCTKIIRKKKIIKEHVTCTASPHVTCYGASCLRLLPKMSRYLETSPKHLHGQRSRGAKRLLPSPTALPSEACPHFRDLSCPVVPQEKNEWPKKFGNKKRHPNAQLCPRGSPKLHVDQEGQHVSTHPEGITNPALPSRCPQTVPTHPVASPNHDQARAESRGWAGTQGPTQARCCASTAVALCGGRVQARGFLAKLAFHVINSCKINSLLPQGVFAQTQATAPLHIEQHQERQTCTQVRNDPEMGISQHLSILWKRC